MSVNIILKKWRLEQNLEVVYTNLIERLLKHMIGDGYFVYKSTKLVSLRTYDLPGLPGSPLSPSLPCNPTPSGPGGPK